MLPDGARKAVRRDGTYRHHEVPLAQRALRIATRNRATGERDRRPAEASEEHQHLAVRIVIVAAAVTLGAKESERAQLSLDQPLHRRHGLLADRRQRRYVDFLDDFVETVARHAARREGEDARAAPVLEGERGLERIARREAAVGRDGPRQELRFRRIGEVARTEVLAV